MIRVPAILIGLATSVLIAADAVPVEYSGAKYVEYTAIGILGFAVVWTLTKTLPSLSNTVKDMIVNHEKSMLDLITNHKAERKEAWDKLDGWERERHEDSRILNETLTEMRVHCKDTVAKLGGEEK